MNWRALASSGNMCVLPLAASGMRLWPVCVHVVSDECKCVRWCVYIAHAFKCVCISITLCVYSACMENCVRVSAVVSISAIDRVIRLIQYTHTLITAYRSSHGIDLLRPTSGLVSNWSDTHTKKRSNKYDKSSVFGDQHLKRNSTSHSFFEAART